MNSSDREIAQKIQEKFEFYVISLVFTLLAISIQTSEFGNSNIADIFELLGWVSLLISGIAGLWRLEFVPVERIKLIQKNEFEEKIFKLQELQLKGETELHVLDSNSIQTINDRINEYKVGITAVTPIIKKLESHNMFKYYTHKLFFIIGLVCLVISRGYEPAKNLIQQIT